MIVIKDKNQPLRQERNYILVEIRGLSTETKPTTYYNQNINAGSIFIEIDTGKMFMFDLANGQWKEV